LNLRHLRALSGAAALLAMILMLIFLKIDNRETEAVPTGSGPSAADTEVPITTSLPNFKSYRNIEKRKQEFFSFLKPFILQENARLLEKRERLLQLDAVRQSNRHFSLVEQDWLELLCMEFKLGAFEMESENTWSKLMVRVDMIPVSLALVQAATESGWGTSRFAREGNNLFGQWCFSPGCGMVPDNRSAGASHEVAIFNSINAAVRSYCRNLNTGYVYRDLREMRYELRRNEQPVSGYELARGLTRYSENGEHYVKLIRSMIRDNMHLIDAP
jgi:Bax protein